MSRPLSVAVVARAVMPLHGVGGLERSVHDLVRHLAARGVRVTLIVPPPAPVRREAAADPFASPLIGIRHVPYWTFPAANRRGTTVLDRSTAYLLYGWRAGSMARALARAGEVDVIHGFGASVLGAARPDLPVPLVLNPQGLEEFGATAERQGRLKRIGYTPLRWAVRRVARAADAIIATDVALESTVARHLRPRPGQVRTIPNGIDLAAVTGMAGPTDGRLLRQRHGIGAGELVFLSVGRLEFNKGFDVLAAALARAAAAGGTLPALGWRWVIVGAGPYGRELERHVAERNIASHVVWAGRASDAVLHGWYEAASVFVHPTRYEGSSLVTLEAMAHRRPVIASRAGGLPDKVHPDVNGWLVEPGDDTALAAAIEEAAASTARLIDMGARSREIVERDFSWTVLVDRQIALYEELLERRLHQRHETIPRA
ncbi:MAG: glycosyltransferase family 4 protein [Acidobacteria bacterium]|nr:glycosyltransferase family 4 protein [Acidobacteriota bacterium]